MYFYICRSIVKNWSLPVKPDSYALHNNFFYVLLFFAFHFRRNCMAFMTILTLFFFSSSKRFWYLSRAYWYFLFFSSSERFWCFSQISFRGLYLFFWCFLAVIFLYVKKILQWFFMHSKPVKIVWNHFSHLKQQPS